MPLCNASGEIASRYSSFSRKFVEDLGDGIQLEMAVIPGGVFDMGSTVRKTFPDLSEGPVHRVRVPAFALGVFPVTRAQWRQVDRYPQVNGAMWSFMPAEAGSNFPVDTALRTTMTEFLARLRIRTGRRYRFPSEAEWEYACRAGTTTAYHFGDAISRQVVSYGEGSPRSMLDAVGSRNAPNRFGLHDMHGAVLECCEDTAQLSYQGAPSDGSPWISRENFGWIARGGCYLFTADSVRSARRYAFGNTAAAGLGFRLALDLSGMALEDPSVRDVISAASRLRVEGLRICPGEVILLQGAGFASETYEAEPDGGIVGSELGGVRVRIGESFCPVLSVSPTEIRAVVPYEVRVGADVQLIVDAQGQSAMPLTANVVETRPGLFTADQSGRGIVAAIHEDGTAHAESNPAAKGSRLSLFGGGGGQTNPPAVTGRIVNPNGGPRPAPALPTVVRIGGVECEVLFVGGESGQVAGLLRVDVRVPAELERSGLWPVLLEVGGNVSQDDVFVAVS